MLLPSTQIAISVSRSSPKRASRRSGRDRHSANTSLPARGLRGVSATSFLSRCGVEPVRDEGLLGSRVASPFGFTPKKVLGIEGCGNLRLRQLQNRLQTLWSSYQTIDFESLKTELTGRPPDVASGAWENKRTKSFVGFQNRTQVMRNKFRAKTAEGNPSHCLMPV